MTSHIGWFGLGWRELLVVYPELQGTWLVLQPTLVFGTWECYLHTGHRDSITRQSFLSDGCPDRTRCYNRSLHRSSGQAPHLHAPVMQRPAEGAARDKAVWEPSAFLLFFPTARVSAIGLRQPQPFPKQRDERSCSPKARPGACWRLPSLSPLGLTASTGFFLGPSSGIF